MACRSLSKAVREVFVSLYEQGLLYRGRRIINEIEALKADVYQVGQGATGVLRVGFSGSATYGVMPRVVGEGATSERRAGPPATRRGTSQTVPALLRQISGARDRREGLSPGAQMLAG